MDSITFIYALFSLFILTSATDLPEFLQVCKRNDPNIENCIKDSVMHLKPYLVDGVAAYNIPSLEPLFLKEVVATSSSSISLIGKDIKAYGSSDFEVIKITADMENLIFIVELLLHHLYVDGRYEMDGKVLLLPITGDGRLTGNFTNTNAVVKFTAKKEPDSSGVDHFIVKDFNLKVTVGNGNLNLENLFGGDKVVGEVVNKAINSNFDAFLREMLPALEIGLSAAFKEIANSIVNLFTFDQLWPSD